MSPISLAGTGTYIIVIESVLKLFGFEFPEGSVGDAVNGLVVFLAFVLLVIGQLRRRDLHLGLIRKS